MEGKGLLAHRTEGRQFVYRAEVSEQEVRTSVVNEFGGFATGVFGGDMAALVSHLITAREWLPATSPGSQRW